MQCQCLWYDNMHPLYDIKVTYCNIAITYVHMHALATMSHHRKVSPLAVWLGALAPPHSLLTRALHTGWPPQGCKGWPWWKLSSCGPHPLHPMTLTSSVYCSVLVCGWSCMAASTPVPCDEDRRPPASGAQGQRALHTKNHDTEEKERKHVRKQEGSKHKQFSTTLCFVYPCTSLYVCPHVRTYVHSCTGAQAYQAPVLQQRPQTVLLLLFRSMLVWQLCTLTQEWGSSRGGCVAMAMCHRLYHWQLLGNHELCHQDVLEVAMTM